MVKRRRSSGALTRKLLRDMRQNLMQFLAMMLLCMLGTYVFAGLDANWRMEEATIESWISEGRLCDLWVKGPAFSRQDLYRIRGTEGIALVQPRITLDASCPELGGEVKAVLHAFEGEIRLNIPKVRAGEALKPSDARGCLMEEQFARAHDLHPGDTLKLDVLGEERRFVIRGLVLSPEYLVTSNDMAPDPQTFGFLIFSSRAFPDVPFNDLVIALEDGADAEAAQRALTDLLPRAVIISQGTHGGTLQARNYIHLFRNMSYLFPVLAYFVAALVVMTTISRMMDTQRIQMGTLKALGYQNRQIRLHYLAYALWPSLIGSLIGLYLAQITLPQILWRMVAVNIRVPEIRMAPISPISWGMAAAEVVLSVLLCVRHESRAARETAASLLRPKPPRAGARILLERIAWLWRRFSFNSKMIFRNIARNKGRTFMSMVGMLFCNMLIICSFGLQDSIPYFINEYFSGTLRYELSVSLESGKAGTLESYRARLDAGTVDGVMAVSASLRTPETSRTVSLQVLPEDITLLRLGEGHSVLDLPDSGIVFTKKLAEKLRVSIGDSIELWLTGETRGIPLTVAAFADSNIGLDAYMSKPAWERLRKGGFTPTSLLISGLTEKGLRQIDDMEEAGTLRYPADQQKQTLRVLDSATAAFSILSGVALGLAFIICYNMGLLNFTERTREYATLKVLGYHQREIRRLILRENTLVALAGVGIGIPPGMALVSIILKMCEFDSMVFEAHIAWTSIALSSLITFAFTWLIQRFLARKVRRIDMVEALKSVE